MHIDFARHGRRDEGRAEFLEAVNGFSDLGHQRVDLGCFAIKICSNRTLLMSRRKDGAIVHMVSAWACRNGVVLGQVKTDEKSNEITAVPELLEKLELKGCIVTLDAMGCQRAIAKQVKEGGGDYVLALKRNQPELDAGVREYFEAAREDDYGRPEIENEETSEEGHGRIEHRSYFLSTDLSSLSGVEKWGGLKGIGLVESERHSGGRISIEQRYFITSLDDVKLFQRAVRSHWGIENKLHWRLDVTCGNVLGGCSSISRVVRRTETIQTPLEAGGPGPMNTCGSHGAALAGGSGAVTREDEPRSIPVPPALRITREPADLIPRSTAA